MNRMLCFAAASCLMLASGQSAKATQLFKLSDHPFGQLSPHDYGLRFDSALSAHSRFSFSVNTDEGAPEMFLSVNDAQDQLHIFGKASYNNHLFDIDFTYNTHVNTVSNGWKVDPSGSNALENHGTITGPGLNGLAFFDQSKNSGLSFNFRADGHRLPGDTSSWVGRGWVTTHADHTNLHGTQDWLFIGVPTDEPPNVPEDGIPEPATAALGFLGLTALSLKTRRRTSR